MSVRARRGVEAALPGWGDRLRNPGIQPRPLRESNDASHLLITAGQAVAWNPTLPGVKSEDTYLISHEGPRLLTGTGNWPSVQMDHRESRVEVPDVLVL